jgi:hypothetical protein
MSAFSQQKPFNKTLAEGEVLNNKQIMTWDLKAFTSSDSIYFTYNSFGKPDLNYIYKIVNGIWVLDSKRKYDYTENSILKEDITEKFVADTWKNSSKNEYIFNENNNLIDSTYFTWNDTTSQWINNYKTSTTFSPEGKKLISLGQRWQNNNWVNNRQYTYVYNSQNQLDTMFSKRWQQNSWRNNAFVIYTYNENGFMTEAVTQTYFGSNISNFSKITYNYENDLLVELANYIWQNNDWVMQDKYKFTYDENKKLLTSSRQSIQNIGWLTTTQNFFFYDQFNNKVRDLTQRLINQQWQDYRRINYFYDNQNNLITEQTQAWSSSSNSWSNLEKTDYNYKNQKLHFKYTSTWKNNVGWIYSTSSTYSYTDSENSSTVTSQRYVDSTSTWINTTRTSTTFNTEGIPLERITENWNELNYWWKNATRSSSTFNESGSVIQTIDYKWIVSWNEDFKHLYTYDNKGNKIHYLGQDKKDTIWVDTLQYIYKYDDDNRITEQIQIKYSNNKWDSTEKQLFIYGEPNPASVKENKLVINQLRNYPNPLNESTSIIFYLNQPSYIEIVITDVNGSKIFSGEPKYSDKGEYIYEFNALGLSPGVYFYSVIINNELKATNKMIILR